MRHRSGSVVHDKRSKVWNFFWWDNGKRKSKVLGRFPTKTKAWAAAKPLIAALETKVQNNPGVPTVSAVAEHYKTEKIPERLNTKRTYLLWLKRYIIPKWGNCGVTDLQARPVELWIEGLDLAPKSRAHIRGMIRLLWEYAMWSGSVPVQRNLSQLRVRQSGYANRAV